MIDVTERIKKLSNNYKITKKENLPLFIDICKELKSSLTNPRDIIRKNRLECTKALNATVKKNIFRDFLELNGLSILSEWLSDSLDQNDEG